MIQTVYTFDPLIITGKICPYCGGKSELVSSLEVYKRYHGMLYMCKPCGAYVGANKRTGAPLGRLANEELREAKQLAHLFFDQIWERLIDRGSSKTQSRGKAYKWLSMKLGLPQEHTHIGMFDIDYCDKVIRLCKPYYDPDWIPKS